MAETTVRSSAIVRNATPQANSSKPHATMSGALPVVNVNMNAGGPQIQGGQQVRQGVTILPPKAGQRNFTTGGLPNQPAKQSVVISAPKGAVAAAPSPELSADQLLLCRHLAVKYVDDQRALLGGDPLPEEALGNIQLAEATIVTIDAVMTAMTAAKAAAVVPTPAPTQPSRSVANQRSVQLAASAAPRRIARPGAPPPPVIVTMDAGQPVQSQDPPSQSQDPPSQSQDPPAVILTQLDDAQG